MLEIRLALLLQFTKAGINSVAHLLVYKFSPSTFRLTKRITRPSRRPPARDLRDINAPRLPKRRASAISRYEPMPLTSTSPSARMRMYSDPSITRVSPPDRLPGLLTLISTTSRPHTLICFSTLPTGAEGYGQVPVMFAIAGGRTLHWSRTHARRTSEGRILTAL